MKKILTVILAAVILLSSSSVCFAAETETVDVYAMYVGQSIKTTVNIPDGETGVTATLPDGTEITVTNIPEDAKNLVIIPITSDTAEAYEWVTECLEEVGVPVIAYDIHFLDANGDRVNANGAKVSIAVSGSDLAVYSVTTAGIATPLSSTVSNGKVSFITDGSHYYAVAGKKNSITVPVSGDENTVHAEVTVDGDTVTLKELDQEEIEKIVGRDVETGVVKIDLTGLDEDVTKIVLPVNTVEIIVEAAEAAQNDTEALQVNFPTGSVKLDDKTMRAIVEQAECNKVLLVLESVGETRLNDTQTAAVADMYVVAGFEAYMVCVSANKRISDFQGGVATLSVPFTVPAGYSESGYTVWHVADDGTLEKLESWFSGGMLYWNVGHFSDFIVTYEGTVETHTITVKDADGGKVEVSTTTPATGETVTITVKPDDGKVLDALSVTDENGNSVSVTDNGDGTYSYIQPDGDVTIQATFKDAAAAGEAYDITVKKTSGGTVTVSHETAVAGQTVTITPTPNSGKVVNKVTVTDADGNAVTVTNNGDGTYSYIQPDSDVTIKVTFKSQSSGSNVQTGDNSHILLWVTLAICSFVCILILLIGRKKNKDEETR